MASLIEEYDALEKMLAKKGMHFTMANWSQAEEKKDTLLELALTFLKLTTGRYVEGNNQWLFVIWIDGTPPDIYHQGNMYNFKLDGAFLVQNQVVFKIKAKSKFILNAMILDKELTKEQVVHA